jgi:hypothetical protein
MISRHSLLFASTALSLALGLPALAAMQAQGNAPDKCGGVCAAVFDADDPSVPLIRVSGDDDDEGQGWVRREHDDDDDDDDDEHCDDDDDDGCAGARGNPAPAGTVPPPASGLFGSGAPPVAVTK